MQYLGAKLILVHFQGKPFSITAIQVYAPTTITEESEVNWFYEDLQDLLELTPKRKVSFHYRGLECKSRKLHDTWINRQVWPRNTKWSRAKANRVLPRECAGHSKHLLPATQKMSIHVDITRCSISKSDWLYCLQLKMEKLYTVSKNKTWSWLRLRQWATYCSLFQNSGLKWRK